MRSSTGTGFAARRAALVLALTLGALAPSPREVAAQGPASPQPGTPQVAPAEFQAVLAEYRAAQQRFTALHDQAFRTNQALGAQETALNEFILRAMNEQIPDADAQMARLDSLRMEAMQAQQAQDMTRLNAAISSAGALQTRLQTARDQVMARADIQARVQALETELMRTMVGIDPGAQALLDRLDELVALLNAGPGPGGG